MPSIALIFIYFLIYLRFITNYFCKNFITYLFIYLFFFINVLQLGIIKRLHDHSIMIYNRHLIFMNYIFLNFPFFKTRLSILVLLKILVISLMGIWCAIPVIETFSNLTDIRWYRVTCTFNYSLFIAQYA